MLHKKLRSTWYISFTAGIQNVVIMPCRYDAPTVLSKVISRRLRLEGNFDFRAVAKRTPGFVGADLTALTKEAAAVAVTRIFSQLAASADAAAAGAAVEAPSSEVATVPMAVAAAPTYRLGGAPLGPTEMAGLAITMTDFEAALPKVIVF